MSEPSMIELAHGVLLVLSAPTGGGKTTIARRLMAADPRLRFSVSHTTREPRPGERDGVDYHFVDEGRFEAMVSGGEFLEWAQVHGHRYGTHKAQRDMAFAAGQDLVLDIDVQGGIQVKRADPSAVLVFVLPPSLEVLLERLGARTEEPGFDLTRRLETALKELELARDYDYNVLNEDLERAVEQVLSVLESARVRPDRLEDRARALQVQILEYLRSMDVHRE
jgi:guanylate kinase